MLKMVDGTGIIGVDMVCPLGGAVSPPQPPNYDKVEVEGVGSLMLPNSLKAPLERVELIGNSMQGENPSPDNPQEIKSAGKWNEGTQKYEIDVKVTGRNIFDINNYVGSINKISESEFHTEAKRGTPIGDINLKAGGKYNISYTFEIDSITNSDCGVRIKCTKSNGTVSYIFDLPKMIGYVCNYTKSAIVPVDTVKCEILLYTDVKLKIGGAFKKLMIAEESENVALNIYQPYTEQTLTLTSDRPITKWDKLVEQGGSMGWLYSGKIAKEFTFVSKASDENISGRIRRRFKTSLNGKFPQTDKVMCNFLTTDNVRNDYSIGIVGSGDIYIYFYENTGVETLEQANHWLKNLPFEKTIIFERKTTEFVPLSESEQTQLRNLHSYNGTTNITVDSGEVPCGIKLTYRKEK
jgi:hypothetical protein